MERSTDVVVTGIGVLSPIAVGRENYWNALKQGTTGFKEINLFDTSKFDVHIGGEISDFDPEQLLGKKGLRTMDRSTRLVCSAAKLALDDAHLTINEDNTHSIGVSIGSTFGSLHSISQFDLEGLTEGPRYVNPSLFPNTVLNSPASNISIRFGIKGFNTTISTGFCSSLDSIIYASDFIQFKRADAVLAGGVEELCEETFMMFHELGLLSGLQGESPTSHPYDPTRNGFIVSEGSAVLMLESREHALKRNTHILATVSGYGNAFEPSDGVPFGTGKGIKAAIGLALDSAEIDADEIDLICGSANATTELDNAEIKAVHDIFGDNVPVSSIKSMIGETYSASGALSVAASIGALNQGFIPPYSEGSLTESPVFTQHSATDVIINKTLILTSDILGSNSALIVEQPNR